MLLVSIPRSITIIAMNQLAKVDYDVATKVSHDVATLVNWSYQHNYPEIAKFAIKSLQFFDNLGSLLIVLVVWIVNHTQ